MADDKIFWLGKKVHLKDAPHSTHSDSYQIKKIRAALVTESLPDLSFGDQIVFREGSSWTLINPTKDYSCSGEINKSLWIEKRNGDIFIKSLTDSSIISYLVFDFDNPDIYLGTVLETFLL